MGVDSGRKTGPHMTKDRAPSDLVAVTGDQTADWSTPGAESTPTWPHPNQECSITGFLGGAVVENLPANAGDTGSSPGLGRSHMPRSN